MPELESDKRIYVAIILILASCIFDMLDGRLARLGGTDSPFGREFDSLADIVSFGVAPALMVHRIVLHQFTTTGWIIASAYLICGALRLARFNQRRRRPIMAPRPRSSPASPSPRPRASSPRSPSFSSISDDRIESIRYPANGCCLRSCSSSPG